MADSTSDFGFKLMSLSFKVRDWLFPRKNILKEVGINPGDQVLDYGCGPGSYVVPASKIVSASGTVYALDIHPLAIRIVQNMVKKNHISNVRTISSDCKTGLPDRSIDIVLLYDTFHELDDPGCVLEEMHRVLKKGGKLSFSDHHMEEADILAELTKDGLFEFSCKGLKTYSFAKG